MDVVGATSVPRSGPEKRVSIKAGGGRSDVTNQPGRKVADSVWKPSRNTTNVKFHSWAAWLRQAFCELRERREAAPQEMEIEGRAEVSERAHEAPDEGEVQRRDWGEDVSASRREARRPPAHAG